MKKTAITALILLGWGMGISTPVRAEESAMQDVFMNGLYGGLAGALVGAATIAFTEEPEDHLENIGIGAGIGVIAGTAYGVLKSSRALAEVEDGKVTVQMPTVRPTLSMGGTSGPDPHPLWQFDLVRVRF